MKSKFNAYYNCQILMLVADRRINAAVDEHLSLPIGDDAADKQRLKRIGDKHGVMPAMKRAFRAQSPRAQSRSFKLFIAGRRKRRTLRMNPMKNTFMAYSYDSLGNRTSKEVEFKFAGPPKAFE